MQAPMARVAARLTEPGEEDVLTTQAALMRPDLGPLPLVGSLTISWNYVAFTSEEGAVEACIALREVQEVAVHDAAPWMNGKSTPALRIITANNKFLFVNIADEELERVQQSVSAVWEAAIERHVAFISSAYAAPVQEPTDLSELLVHYRSRIAGRQVNAPPVRLIQMEQCKLRLKRGAWLHGTFLLFAHFAAFVADSSDLAIRLVLPYTDIIVPVQIDKSGGSFTVCTRLLNRAIEIAFTPATRASHMAQLLEHSAALTAAPVPLSLSLGTHDARPGLFALIDTDAVSKGWAERNASRLELWSRYVSINGLGTDMLRTPQLSALVRGGLPDELRGALWWALSGAALDHQADFQQSLAAGCTDRARREIEQDVRRTLPSHPLFQSEAGLASLRRVLIAYAARNPSLGYCQSMNFLAAMLLLYLPEHTAFAVLARLCEHLLPHYHSPEMVGAKLDLHVLDQLLEERMRPLRSHLIETHLTTPIISLSWFLCLFCQTLPLEGALYALDVLLCEGERCTILFELSLALFAQLEHFLLRQVEPDHLLRLFRTASLPELLSSLDQSFVPYERVAHLRASLRPALVESIQRDLRSRALQRNKTAPRPLLRRPPRGIAQRRTRVVLPTDLAIRTRAAMRLQSAWRGRVHRLNTAAPHVTLLRSRIAALSELLNSESEYVSALDTVVTVFLSPLRLANLAPTARAAQQVLFAPLETLIAAHRPVTLALRTAVQDKSSSRLDLSATLAALGAALPRYVEYVRYFGAHRLALETLRGDDVAGPCLSAAFRAHARALHHRDLDYLLLLPLHRPARLRHLFGELLRVRGSHDPLAADLAAAMEALDGTLTVLGHAENAAAEDERMGRLVLRIKGAHKHLPSLKLLRHGPAKGAKGETVLVFLFADCAVVCKSPSDHHSVLECVAHCELNGSIALSVQSDACALMLFDNRTASAAATVFLSTPSERDSWLAAFWEAALALRTSSSSSSSAISPSNSGSSVSSLLSSNSNSTLPSPTASPLARPAAPSRALAALQALWRSSTDSASEEEGTSTGIGTMPASSLYDSDIVSRTRAASPPLPHNLASAVATNTLSAHQTSPSAKSSLFSSLSAIASRPTSPPTSPPPSTSLFSSFLSRPSTPPTSEVAVRQERTQSLPHASPVLPTSVSPSSTSPSPSATPTGAGTRSPSTSFSSPRHVPPQRPLPARPPIGANSRRSTEGESALPRPASPSPAYAP